MRILFDIGSRLPTDDAGLPAFDAIVKASKEAGATGLHGALTQRRYEEFDTFTAFKASFELTVTVPEKCVVRSTAPL